MKTVNIQTKFKWKFIKSEDRYTAVCDRLNLTTEGDSLEETLLMIQDVMGLLFKDIYQEGELNQYTFDHSIAYRIDEYENFIEVIPSPIIVE